MAWWKELSTLRPGEKESRVLKSYNNYDTKYYLIVQTSNISLKKKGDFITKINKIMIQSIILSSLNF